MGSLKNIESTSLNTDYEELLGAVSKLSEAAGQTGLKVQQPCPPIGDSIETTMEDSDCKPTN